jgi:FimV-like protein
MHKGFIFNTLLLVYTCLYLLPVEANVNHVSINSRQFELGQHPQLKVNLVADKNEVSKLAFYVQQMHGSDKQQEQLMVRPINNYLLMVTGTEEVTDKQAKLIVQRYRRGNWNTYLELPLFDSPHSEKSATLVQSKAISQSIADVKAQAAQNPASSVSRFASNSVKDVKAKAVKTQTPEPTIEINTATSDKPAVEASKMNPAPEAQAQGSQGICRLPYEAGQTLWRIANHYAPSWRVNIYGAMLAIYNSNPQAFAGGDIQRLMVDAELICPTRTELSQYLDKDIDILKFEIQLAKAQLVKENKRKAQGN